MHMLNLLKKSFPIRLLKPFAMVQFGPPRSGSTLVFNLMQEIFPHKKIFKAHAFRRMCETLTVVATYRNPLDCIASCLLCSEIESPTNDDLEKQIRTFNESGIKKIPELLARSNMLFLRYEDFVHDFDYVFDEFESFFKITIPANLRVILKEKYGMKNVEKMIENMDSFGQHDKKSLLHGNHISKYKGASYHKKVFSETQIARLNTEYADALTALGY